MTCHGEDSWQNVIKWEQAVKNYIKYFHKKAKIN